MIHEALWERLAALSPDDVCQRTGAEHDTSNGLYVLPLLNRHILVDPVGRNVRWSNERYQAERAPGFHEALFPTVYLIEAKEMRPAGQWVTAESLRAGTFFFRGPHIIPTDKVAHRFGRDREAFLTAGSRLGGMQVKEGDACIQLQVVPRIAVRLVLWLGDEEFPSKVTMLFDKLVDEHVPLDALHSMTHLVVSSLLQASDGGT